MGTTEASITAANGESNLLTKSQGLELAFRASLEKMDGISKAELARRYKMQIILLEEEIETLHDHVAEADERMDALVEEKEELQLRIAKLEMALEAEQSTRDGESRSHARDLSNLRAELEAMSNVSSDSTKLLTEKLTLSHELSTLKPELEHLRSQLAEQQALLSEKLALQRQIDTLKVELATERAASRNQNENVNKIELEELRNLLTDEKRQRQQMEQRFEEERSLWEQTKQTLKSKNSEEQADKLREELESERRERDKVQRSFDKERSNWEVRKAALESRLDDMKTKLKSSKEQLKDAQAELAQARTTLLESTDPVEARPKASRRRAPSEVPIDNTFGTPDGVVGRGRRAASFKTKIELGEKSNFSITPFLNRTISVGPETPEAAAEEKEADLRDTEGGADAADNAVSSGLRALLTESTSPSISRSKNIAVEIGGERPVLADAGKGRNNARTVVANKMRLPNLDKVMEEVESGGSDQDENKSLEEDVAEKPARKALKSKQTVVETEPKKRKRTLGVAKTIFDEDDGEITKRPAKMNLGPAKLLRKSVLGGGKETQSLSVFSPLKKDRRGARASFLS